MGKLNSFTELEAWREAHKLAISIYKLTKTFPATDRLGLTSQMQRAALPITSNLAEGFGRESLKDARHFYIMARGSLTELQNQLLLARDVDKITPDTFLTLAEKSVVVHKLINSILRALRSKTTPTNSNHQQVTK